MYNDCSIDELQHLIATKSDEKAYNALFNRFAPALIQFSHSIVHLPEPAEEIVSDVFIRIWEKRHSLDQVINLKIYLYISVKNYSINYLRAKKNQEVFDLDNIPADLIQTTMPNPLQITCNRQLEQRIHDAISHLPPKCKLIYKLAKEDGLRIKEIAEILQISSKTVENQMTIALKKMANSLKGLSDKVIRLRS